jgi:hypothetical protein
MIIDGVPTTCRPLCFTRCGWAFTAVANARLAEKDAERIAHHATVNPAGLGSLASPSARQVTAHLPDHQSLVATLTARIETLESEFAKVEAAAAVHRADFERERERCERLMAEVLKATAE